MTGRVLVLRPQPGADATAKHARAAGLEPIVAPLFEVAARPWSMPEERVEALLVTSANAARMMGPAPDRTMPVFAVGEATASALRLAGFRDLIVGGGGVEELLAQAEGAGMTSMLHLAGEDRTPFQTPDIRIVTRIVYAAEPLAPSAGFHAALGEGAVALLHSARAARRFRELAGASHRVAALSPAVLAAAGSGWAAAVAAERPTDEALLAAAARLCQG